MSVVERERVVTCTDVLTRAADLLEEFDWQQGHAGSKDEGRMCAVGAIWAAADDLGIGQGTEPAIAAWRMELPGYELVEAGELPLARWNDQPGRTKVELVATLRHYAKEADGA